MRNLRLKAVISSLLLVILLLVAISGIMLYFGKTGMILGFSRAFLLRFHACSALLFLFLGGCHFILNFKQYRQEIKKLFKYKKLDCDD